METTQLVSALVIIAFALCTAWALFKMIREVRINSKLKTHYKGKPTRTLQSQGQIEWGVNNRL